MEIIRTVAELRDRLAREPSVGCVPTMGNIHDGHLSLVRLGLTQAPFVVTTIFVNRLQFGQGEDFDSYPRTFEDDCAKLEAAGCALVFHPDEREMYPEPQVFSVDPPPVANKLEGRFRPGHFRGMATVVLKLFNIVQPQIAVFGKKDYQQLMVIRRMVQQFALPIVIEAAETSRADDGLALSSRNGYLNASERAQATALSEALRTLAERFGDGVSPLELLETQARQALSAQGWQPDYLTVRRQSDLSAPTDDDSRLGAWVVLGAARLGTTRLIDNIEFSV